MGYIMRVAIYDEDKTNLNYIYNKIEPYLKELRSIIQIETFYREKDLIDTFSRDLNYVKILLLNIDRSSLRGFKIAKVIRKYNKDILIIFLSSYDELVYESFKYSPFRFIRKEKLEEEVYEALSSAIEFWKEKVELQYSFHTDNGKVKVCYKDIVYIECLNKKVYITINSKQYRIIGVKFSNMVSEFSAKGFIQIHRSYMVNLRYISTINKYNLILENGCKLLISRYREKVLKRAFLLY